MLDYENQMFLEILHSDGLLVVGKGLGLENIFTWIISTYSNSGNLVLVLGTSDQEENYFTEKIKDAIGEKEGGGEETKLPIKITADVGTNERKRIYLNGGVLFITPRILTVDLLVERIPAELITGILVYRAHKTMESCQDTFILRLYRQKKQKRIY